MIGPFFSLRKPKKTFRFFLRRFNRKAKSLDQYTKDSILSYLQALREAILKKDTVQAKKMAKELQQASDRLMPRTSFEKLRDLASGILFALVIAVLIRTMWFELYTIPTGSMRPTLKEEDYLVVSKTDYGINVPLQVKHFYFDPSLVQRGSIIVFNGANMDIADVDTTYFYLFPGKKQFVKRLIGKPGDSIYFYGGKIYGVDANGNELNDFKASWFDHLEHIPFIRFEGKVETSNPSQNGVFSSAIFHQMNEPVAKLSIHQNGMISKEMIARQFDHYSDLWGMKHFAMARLLTQQELQQIHPNEKVEKGVLYLELTHHPTLQGATLVRDEYNRLRPDIAMSTSIIPLQQRHLDEIAKHMTTCRFKVQKESAWRYGWNPKNLIRYLPFFPKVPDGTYEIQDGKVYTLPFPTLPIIGLFTNGFTKQQIPSHPLHSSNAETVHKLFNLGIELINPYLPKSKNQKTIPSRYAYFRNGDLYLMNAPILKQNDPVLVDFHQKEQEKLTPFKDLGPPTVQEILKHGIRIPEKMYLVLGDNHAMSADSRQFGFVPEDNLKGGVSFLFAPIDKRLGKPLQPPQPHATLSNLTVWGVFLITAFGTSLYYRRKLKRPL